MTTTKDNEVGDAVAVTTGRCGRNWKRQPPTTGGCDKMNGKRLIVARSGGSNTSWKAERDYYVKHFLLFPCLCFPPPPLFFLHPLYSFCCLESSSVCDEHLPTRDAIPCFLFPSLRSPAFPSIVLVQHTVSCFYTKLSFFCLTCTAS